MPLVPPYDGDADARGWGNFRYIQQMLGHAELSTTEIYTHVSIRMLKQVHTATHPAAALDTEHPQSAPKEANGEGEEEKE